VVRGRRARTGGSLYLPTSGFTATASSAQSASPTLSAYARHGGAPGGREAHRFINDAATLECLLLSREREFTAWRARWRDCLEGVYSGKVALLPGFERDLLAAWRARRPAEDDGMRVCRDCGGEFQRPSDAGCDWPHVPAQRCPACAEPRPA